MHHRAAVNRNILAGRKAAVVGEQPDDRAGDISGFQIAGNRLIFERAGNAWPQRGERAATVTGVRSTGRYLDALIREGDGKWRIRERLALGDMPR